MKICDGGAQVPVIEWYPPNEPKSNTAEEFDQGAGVHDTNLKSELPRA